MGEAHLEPTADLLLGRAMSGQGWVVMGLGPLMGRDMSRGGYGLRKFLKQPVCWWLGLYSSSVSFLAWGIPALSSINCWVGPSLGQDGSPQQHCSRKYLSVPLYFSHQCLYPYGEPHPHPTLPPGDSPKSGRRSGPASYQTTPFALEGFPGGVAGKEFAYTMGDLGSVPGLGRASWGNSCPLQYSGLDNSMDYSSWGQRVTGSKSQTWMSDFHFPFPGTHEILCVSFKGEVSISSSSMGLLQLGPDGL